MDLQWFGYIPRQCHHHHGTMIQWPSAQDDPQRPLPAGFSKGGVQPACRRGKYHSPKPTVAQVFGGKNVSPPRRPPTQKYVSSSAPKHACNPKSKAVFQAYNIYVYFFGGQKIPKNTKTFRRRFLFEISIFSFHGSFRGCNVLKNAREKIRYEFNYYVKLPCANKSLAFQRSRDIKS